MTATYALCVGLVVRRGQRTFEFDRRLEDGTVIFIDQIDKSPHRWQLGQLYRDIHEGKLHLVTGTLAKDTSPNECNGLPLIFDLESLPERHATKVKRQVSYIRALRRQGLTRGMRQAVEAEIPKIASTLEDKRPPSTSTVMHWWRQFERNDGVVNSLVSGHVFKKVGKRKPWAQAIIKETLRKVYCTRARRSLKAVAIEVNRRLAQAAKERGAPADEMAVSESTIRRYKSEIEPYALDVARFGAAYARNKWRYSLRGANCTRALQRYEIDHTLMDIVVICDRTGFPLGRPTITVVVDSFSGYVVGFFVSFWGPGLATTFSSLKVAFGPKDLYTLSSMPMEHKWLAMGICELLAMDNGLEFHSPQMRSVALQLDMDLLYCPVRQPWLKPTIERVMGSHTSYLPVEGRVEKPLNNYLPIDPRQSARVTFSALCEGLFKAFIDIHAFEINDKKIARPYDLFEESIALLPAPPLPGDMRHLDIVVGESRTLSVGNEGVVMKYLRYNSKELQQLRRSVACNFKTQIKFTPGNLGQVFLQVPNSANWMPVPCCFPEYAEGLSVVQHKAIRQHAKSELKARGVDEILMRAKNQLHEHWNSQVIIGKRLKSNHLRALSGLTSAHSLGEQPPEVALHVATPSGKSVLCDTDLVPPPREIPVFDTELVF